MSAHPNQHMLGGVVLDEADGSRFVRNASGIDDAPEIRTGLDLRSQQHGAWDADGFYGARVIQLEGYAEAATSADAHAFADLLRSLSPAVLHELVVESEGRGTRSAMVRMQAGAVLDWLTDDAFTYVLTVVAPDPLLYGPPQFAKAYLSGTAAGTGRVWSRTWPRTWGVPAGVVPGAVAVANAGTAAYWPTLRIDGPSVNPKVTLAGTGDWVRYGGSLATGQWLDIDCANRRVLLNGQVSVRHLVTSSGSWLAVPTGGDSVSWTDDLGSSTASLSVWSFEGAWS